MQSQQHTPLFEHKLTLDWGISDTYHDRRQLQLSGFLALDAIFLGNINLGETKSHQVMADLDTRYGLTDRISVDVDVPYIYRHSNFIVGGAGGAANTVSDASANSSDIGDVNFGIYYQFLKETNNLPDVVGSLRIKAPTGSSPFGIKLAQVDANNTNLVAPTKLPTGTGFWNITAGLSLLKTYDPVVLFGSVSYTYNIARSFQDISSVIGQTEPATVKIGDVVQFGGGVALAFSDKDSASISYTMALEPESQTKSPGGTYSKVPGSETTAAALDLRLESRSEQALDDQRFGIGRPHARHAELRDRCALSLHFLTCQRYEVDRARITPFEQRYTALRHSSVDCPSVGCFCDTSSGSPRGAAVGSLFGATSGGSRGTLARGLPRREWERSAACADRSVTAVRRAHAGRGARRPSEEPRLARDGGPLGA